MSTIRIGKQVATARFVEPGSINWSGNYRQNGDQTSYGWLKRKVAWQLNDVFPGDGGGRCLAWPWAISSRGHGVLKIGTYAYGAHRVAWTIGYGLPVDLPPGTKINHDCGNYACVNVRHLSASTGPGSSGPGLACSSTAPYELAEDWSAVSRSQVERDAPEPTVDTDTAVERGA